MKQKKHKGQVGIWTQRHRVSPQVHTAQADRGGKWFGKQPWASEAGRVQPPESRRGGPGRGCSGQRQIAVIREFKRLGEGLRAQALPQVRTCPPNPGPHLGLPGTLPHLTALSPVLSGSLFPSQALDPSLSRSLSPSLWVSVPFCLPTPLQILSWGDQFSPAGPLLPYPSGL